MAETYEQLMNRLNAEGILGSCEFFNPKPFIDAANILVAADEPLRAIQVLENLPGFYRDRIPLEIRALKKKIYSRLATPSFYSRNSDDTHYFNVEYSKRVVSESLRGRLIHDDVKAFNEKHLIPHLVDVGPGEYWLPVGLHAHGCSFTYQDIGLCEKARDKALEFIRPYMRTEVPKDKPKIFVACEIIEHLHHEEDLAAECHRLDYDPDIIHVSTPLYTFDGRSHMLDWVNNKGDLGHLRTYTPSDFSKTVANMFPGYSWDCVVSNIMHMKGVKHGTEFKGA